MIKDRMKTMEGYDLYDVILSHLLDEGYKPPAGKMAKRVAHKMFKGVNTLIKAKDAGEILDTTVGGQVAVQKSDKLAKQAQKIYQTAKRHNPEDSKEKERQNRAVGDTAREVGPRAAASLRDRYNRGGSSTNTPKKKNGYWKDIRDGIINGVSDALGEQVDLYDIILSHLLDEGYADTVENAESIMVNMSEDWRQSIMEEKKPLPIDKMKRKERELEDKADREFGPASNSSRNSPERKAALRTSERASTIGDVRRNISTRGGKRQSPMPEVGRYKPEEDLEDYKQYSSGETTAQRARRDPEFRTRMIKDRMKTMEGYDLYDVILSHLLDEGYANTNENALVIMANMSEEWIESICEI